MREEFKQKMGETTSSTQSAEEELPESEDIVIHDESPPHIIQTHHQHLDNYVKMGAEEGVVLTLGEDRAATLIIEVYVFFFLDFLWSLPF